MILCHQQIKLEITGALKAMLDISKKLKYSLYRARNRLGPKIPKREIEKGLLQVCANFSKIPHDAHLYILMRNSS